MCVYTSEKRSLYSKGYNSIGTEYAAKTSPLHEFFSLGAIFNDKAYQIHILVISPEVYSFTILMNIFC